MQNRDQQWAEERIRLSSNFPEYYKHLGLDNPGDALLWQFKRGLLTYHEFKMGWGAIGGNTFDPGEWRMDAPNEIIGIAPVPAYSRMYNELVLVLRASGDRYQVRDSFGIEAWVEKSVLIFVNAPIGIVTYTQDINRDALERFPVEVPWER